MTVSTDTRRNIAFSVPKKNEVYSFSVIPMAVPKVPEWLRRFVLCERYSGVRAVMYPKEHRLQPIQRPCNIAVSLDVWCFPIEFDLEFISSPLVVGAHR